MAEVTTQALATGPTGAIEPSRVRVGVVIVGAVIVGFSVPAAFTPGAAGALTFVAALCVSALAVLLVAMEHPRQADEVRWAEGPLVGRSVLKFLPTQLIAQNLRCRLPDAAASGARLATKHFAIEKCPRRLPHRDRFEE